MSKKKWKSFSFRKAESKFRKGFMACLFGIIGFCWLGITGALSFWLAKSGSPLIYCAFAAAKPGSAIEMLLFESERLEQETLSEEEESQGSLIEDFETAAPAPQKAYKEETPYVPVSERGIIEETQYSAAGGGIYVSCGKGIIKNSTKLSTEKIKKMLKKKCDINLSMGSAEPQILVYHTHTTEAFEEADRGYFSKNETWRTTDLTKNMAAVGDAFCSALEEKGIAVLHDKTLHDDPGYTGSYDRSAKTVAEYLDENPTLKICIDLHRDAIEPSADRIIKPTVLVGEKKAAQIMIIAGCDDGTMNMPDYAENLRLAAAIQNKAEELFPGLMRPVLFDYRKYNMDLSPGLLLIEIGSTGNTLEEAEFSAALLAEVFAAAFAE